MQPLRVINKKGVHLYINNNLEWFYPYLALIIADWPKACAICATYGSPNSLHPCHFCLVDRDALNNVHIKEEDIIIRYENDIKINLCQNNNSDRYPKRLSLFTF